MLNFREVEPRLKGQHFQQVAQQVFGNLKSIQKNIINRIHFNFDDKENQGIYNYCTKFCFEWEDLKDYIQKQLKTYKKKDKRYYEFILRVSECVDNKKQFKILKQEIETRFWELKDKYKCPEKKEFQISCNTLHTVDIELKEFQWIFSIDNNDIIGGSEKKGIYDKMVIPVKFSDYHKKILDGKNLANTFILKYNTRKQVEVIGTYDTEIKYPKINKKNILLGVDIGLKKFITTSESEIILQNPKIISKLDKVLKKQANRERLETHLQKKLNDDSFRLSDNHYLIQQQKLTEFVLNDNRHKIKAFLNGLQDYHLIIEDLKIAYSRTKSKRVNYLLRRLHIQQIKNDLVKYAKKYGIQLTQVNSAYTSEQCHVCGHVDSENRKVQETFCCTKCGYTANADYNASINIKERIHNKLINLKTPVWRVKEVLTT